MAKFFIDRPIFAWVIAIFIVVLGGVGLGGGYWLAFADTGTATWGPAELHGARGFWSAATAGVIGLTLNS